MSDEAHVQPDEQPEEQPEQPQPRGITRITVQGFKSLRDETSIEIRPLTILAGANSSGKSSIMQPLLLMKQTLEAPYDPGPLKLDGPNVNFSETKQLFSLSASRGKKKFIVKLELGRIALESAFVLSNTGLYVDSTEIKASADNYFAKAAMSRKDIKKALNNATNQMPPQLRQVFVSQKTADADITMHRDRCFLKIDFVITLPNGEEIKINSVFDTHPSLGQNVVQVIHVPGLRGAPERNYKRAGSAGARVFPGTFENYVASIVHRWQSANQDEFKQLVDALARLGVASVVRTAALSDVEIEVRVGRTLTSDATDTVSIADVGFGVSQVLPVVVALLIAKPGQLVYIEQPELHLHPRAQAAMAGLLADAAKRGVRVVIETHSSILLLAIQTLIAEQQLDHNLVAMHWFSRDPDSGGTKVDSHFPDETGSLGDWPEDFDETELYWQRRYARASNARLREQQAKGRLAQNNGSNGSNGSHEADVGDIAAQSESATQAAD